MAVTSDDLVWCGAANHAENDSDAQGGAIDKGTLVVMDGLELSGSGTVRMLSSVSLTATFRVTGRDGGGAVVTEDFAFSAATGPVSGSQVFERILTVVKQSGTVPSNAKLTLYETATGQAKCYLYGSGLSPTGTEIDTVRRLFIAAARPAAASPPATKYLHEKVFLLNTHGSDTLTQGQVRKTADPDSWFTFDLEDQLDGTEQVSNRITTPSNVLGSFDSLDKTLQDAASPATGALAAGEAQGVWVRLALEETDSAGVTSLNLQGKGVGL